MSTPFYKFPSLSVLLERTFPSRGQTKDEYDRLCAKRLGDRKELLMRYGDCECDVTEKVDGANCCIAFSQESGASWIQSRNNVLAEGSTFYNAMDVFRAHSGRMSDVARDAIEIVRQNVSPDVFKERDGCEPSLSVYVFGELFGRYAPSYGVFPKGGIQKRIQYSGEYECVFYSIVVRPKPLVEEKRSKNDEEDDEDEPSNNVSFRLSPSDVRSILGKHSFSMLPSLFSGKFSDAVEWANAHKDDDSSIPVFLGNAHIEKNPREGLILNVATGEFGKRLLLKCRGDIFLSGEQKGVVKFKPPPKADAVEKMLEGLRAKDSEMGYGVEARMQMEATVATVKSKGGSVYDTLWKEVLDQIVSALPDRMEKERFSALGSLIRSFAKYYATTNVYTA